MMCAKWAFLRTPEVEQPGEHRVFPMTLDIPFNPRGRESHGGASQSKCNVGMRPRRIL